MKSKCLWLVAVCLPSLVGGCCYDAEEEAKMEAEERNRIAWRTWYRLPPEEPIIVEPEPDPVATAVQKLLK